MKKLISTLLVLGLTILPLRAWSATLFSNGWERHSGTGCTAPVGTLDIHITDKTSTSDPLGWDIDSSYDPCFNGALNIPAMETVSDVKHSGAKSFRYDCYKRTDVGNTGLMGVILKTFNTPQTELYIRYYVMWSSNFKFVDDMDFKGTFARCTDGQHTYNSYYGKIGDADHGILRYGHWSGTSVAPYSTNITLNKGEWILMEWHLVSGAAGVGYMEAKVNGTLANWNSVRNGSGTDYGTRFYVPAGERALATFEKFSLDNTINGYNDNSFPNALDGTAYIWYDDVEINSGDGWIGALGEPDAPATIVGVGSTTANGSYKAGSNVNITVTWTKAQTGDATIELETGTTDRTVDCTSTSSTTCSGTYTVQAGDTSADLTVKTIANKSGGTPLADAASNAMTDFSIPAGNNLADNKALVIDTTAPAVTAFTIPATGNALLVFSSTFTCTDAIGVTGYVMNESATPPAAGAAGWTASAPTSYTFATEGAKTMYGYCKDAAGNVSDGTSDGITITLPAGNITHAPWIIVQ